MSYKPIDRHDVRTKELMVDGQAMDAHYDPFLLAARHMWNDIESYESGFDHQHQSGALRVNIPNL